MQYRPDKISLWCSAGNSILLLEKSPGKNLALRPCTAEACPEWEDGMCCHLERVGKIGRM